MRSSLWTVRSRLRFHSQRVAGPVKGAVPKLTPKRRHQIVPHEPRVRLVGGRLGLRAFEGPIVWQFGDGQRRNGRSRETVCSAPHPTRESPVV